MKTNPNLKFQTEVMGLNEKNEKVEKKTFENDGYRARDYIIRNSYFKNSLLIFEEGYVKFENCVFDGEVSIFNKGKMGFDAIEIVSSKTAPESKKMDIRAQSVEILQCEFMSVDNLIIDAISVDINASNIMSTGEISYSGYLNLFHSDLDLIDLKNVSKEEKKAAINIKYTRIDGEDKEFNNIRQVLNK